MGTSLARFEMRTTLAAADYFVHRHHDTEIPEDHLDVWRPIPTGGFDDQPSIQINQADGVTASVSYGTDDARALARAILEAAGVDPREAFTG
ncbi:MAG: hypothetical protein ABWY04_10070, partial [Arthrobacter sp.]